MQVRPVKTANETFGESCPWGFILGRKRQKRGKCGESFPSQRAQVQTDGGIWVRGKYISEMFCRHSVNQCSVPWMKTLFGALENRSDSVLTSNEFLWSGSFLRGLQDDPAQVVLQQGHRLLPKKRVSQRTSLGDIYIFWINLPTGCLNIEKLRSRRAPNWTRASCTSLRSTPTTDPPFVNTVAKCSLASTIRATDARTQTVGSMSMKTVERFANIFSSSNNFSLIQLCTIACGVDFTKFIKVVENLKKKEAKKFDENEVHEQGIEEYKKRAPKLTKENSIKIDLSGFTLKTTLGRGGYGKVRMGFVIPLMRMPQVILAERKSDKQLCAIKSVSKKEVLSQDCADICMLEREILAMGSECRCKTSQFKSRFSTQVPHQHVGLLPDNGEAFLRHGVCLWGRPLPSHCKGTFLNLVLISESYIALYSV